MTTSLLSVDAALIRRALYEDRAHADLTTRALISPSLRVRAHVIAKAAGVVAGTMVAQQTFHAIDRRTRCTIRRRDGQRVKKDDVILALEGSARAILAAERTALNFLGHLSGIATLTRAFVDPIKPSRAAILDTRKTLPGLRALEKHAVHMGGGQSHRFDLADAILIKTNHLRASRLPTPAAIARAKRVARGKPVEIEVTNLQEFQAALTARPHIILLDNWPLRSIKRAVRLRRPGIRLEVSGGVTLANVRAIARTGVDRISIGRLTHSAPALNISLRVLTSEEDQRIRQYVKGYRQHPESTKGWKALERVQAEGIAKELGNKT